jgi:uncharacterized protein (TIGR02646 family)
MINILRGPEPSALVAIRDEQLKQLRQLLPAPTGKQIPDVYRRVGDDLRLAQHCKCCYCEVVVQKKFNDVEHYRPKATATRLPGCSKTHGYWWLAYTWANLLFSCPNCNRSGKNDLFPLAKGSSSLDSEAPPPGSELPLLIDPAGLLNPVTHIFFAYESLAGTGPKQWYARPRDGSLYGQTTIIVCDLNRQELLEIRENHYQTVIEPQVRAIKRELELQRPAELDIQFARAKAMIGPKNQFAAFTYDAFRSAVPDRILKDAIGKIWPAPQDVCRT